MISCIQEVRQAQLSEIMVVMKEWKIGCYREPAPSTAYYYRKKVAYSEAYERADVLGDSCLCCGTHDDLALDHVVPLSGGGDDTVYNLQTLCRSCNSRKQTMYHEYRPSHLLPAIVL